MKIDMLQALSLRGQNSDCVKNKNSSEDFLSTLINQFTNKDDIELNNKTIVEEDLKKTINESNQENEIDESLIESIGTLLNKINSDTNKDSYDELQNEGLENYQQLKEDISEININTNLTKLINSNIKKSVDSTPAIVDNLDDISSEVLNGDFDINLINNILKNNVDKINQKVDNLISKLKIINKVEGQLIENINNNENTETLDLNKFNNIIKETIVKLGLEKENVDNQILKESIIYKKDINLNNEYEANKKNVLDISDELDVISNYRLLTLENKKSKQVEVSTAKDKNIFSYKENEIELMETSLDYEVINESKVSSITGEKAKNIINNDSINGRENELNILNNIVMPKNNSVVEIKDEVSKIQVIRSEYISEDFVQTIEYLKVNNKEEISVRMNPKDLGELNIRILKGNNEEKVIVTLRNEETFNLLKENVNEIKNHLSSLDIKVKEVEVEIKSESQNNFSHNSNQQSNRNNNKEEKKSRNVVFEQNHNEYYLENEDENINLLI
ncbi:MAG: flagellar hook-length control protein FliK [Clostridium saudiense]|uniref:flagellar hook-length control protein FliK n=1 Tax=Clostridium saudiense TaxID=1414720 RepID=UPI0018A9B9D4|nr:flagellar hook-length control protein FliK [Clostridium saudiense]MDU3520678.1 flagellar hook-length control protein FliK [Clostridium saudiense]